MAFSNKKRNLSNSKSRKHFNKSRKTKSRKRNMKGGSTMPPDVEMPSVKDLTSRFEPQPKILKPKLPIVRTTHGTEYMSRSDFLMGLPMPNIRKTMRRLQNNNLSKNPQPDLNRVTPPRITYREIVNTFGFPSTASQSPPPPRTLKRRNSYKKFFKSISNSSSRI
jgi:hypothetical protein